MIDMKMTLHNINEQTLISILLTFNISNENDIITLFTNNSLLIYNDIKCLIFSIQNNNYDIYHIDILEYENIALQMMSNKFRNLQLTWMDAYKKKLIIEFDNANEQDSIIDNIINEINILLNVNTILVNSTCIRYKKINNSLFDTQSNQIIFIVKKSIIDTSYLYSPYAFSITKNQFNPIALNNNTHYCFYNYGINQISIPSNVKNILPSEFSNCINLSSIDFSHSNINEIGNAAFIGTAIKNISIPTTISAIHEYTFEDAHIEQLNIPENIKLIDKYAFANNFWLSSINIYANDNISIDNNAFADARSLLSVVFKNFISEKLNLNSFLFNDCVNLQYVIFEKGISDTIFNQAKFDKKIINYKILIPDKNYQHLKQLVKTDLVQSNYLNQYFDIIHTND